LRPAALGQNAMLNIGLVGGNYGGNSEDSTPMASVFTGM